MTTANVSGVTRRKVQVQTNFERWAFLFMRVSGLALLILALTRPFTWTDRPAGRTAVLVLDADDPGSVM